MTAPLHGLPRTAGTWLVPDSRTQVSFTVGNLGRRVHGSVPLVRGEVELDPAGAPVRASAELALDRIDTGVAKRDLDLRKPRFLDTDRHPTMSWSAERFTPDGGGGWTAEGRLTLRGTSAPLAVTAAPDLEDGCLRVRATALLDRRAVGIRAPSFMIGRTVDIAVDAWLVPGPS